LHAHASAPARVGIAGGGTDLPAWTSSGRVGRCLSIAIARYAHALVIPRHDGRFVAAYRQLDEATYATEIANGLIRESARMAGFYTNIEVHTASEISSRGSGLGASSAIAVALAAAFGRMKMFERGEDYGEMNHASRGAIAEMAWEVEIDRLRRPIGRQDHMAAAYGGLRLYRFERDQDEVERAEVEREFSEEDARWLAAHLVLVQLPGGHDAREILSGVKSVEQLAAAAEAVDHLGRPVPAVRVRLALVQRVGGHHGALVVRDDDELRMLGVVVEDVRVLL